MASDTAPPAPTPPPGQPRGQPQLLVRAQYVKDLSFENPGAPKSLARRDGQPEIAVNVDVTGNRLSPNQYELVLAITATARTGGETTFIAELVYGAVMSVENVPIERAEPLVLIEGPRLLFPFARNIMADLTRDGGYPPLLLQPMDFAALYRRHLERQAAEKPATPPN